jgi:hypothetical protein
VYFAAAAAFLLEWVLSKTRAAAVRGEEIERD